VSGHRVRLAAILIGVAVASLGAACGQGTDPARLAVGDCFDIPSETSQIGTITKRACTEAHAGEVFHIFQASTPSDAYPSDTDWEQIIYPICDPEFETYTGTFVGDRLDIEYLYLVPTPERWTSSDRRVTCFISSLEGTPLTKSHRAPAP
jgi:hypothetical protein